MEQFLDLILGQLRAWVATELGATTIGGILVSFVVTVGYKATRWCLGYMGLGQAKPLREEIQSLVDALLQPGLWERYGNFGVGALTLRHQTRPSLYADAKNGLYLNTEKGGKVHKEYFVPQLARRERKAILKAARTLISRAQEAEVARQKQEREIQLQGLASGLKRDQKELGLERANGIPV